MDRGGQESWDRLNFKVLNSKIKFNSIKNEKIDKHFFKKCFPSYKTHP